MILELVVLLISALIFYGFLEQKRPKNFPAGSLGLPILGYLPFLAPDSHIRIGKIGRTYGGIFSVKLGSYWFVVLNDFDTIKAALKTDVFSGRPNYLIPMAVAPNGIVYNDGPAWVEQRRFALKTLRDFGFGKISHETSIQEEVKDFTDYLKKRTNSPIELKELFAISIVNGLWHILTGEKFALDDPTPRSIYSTVKAGITEPEIQGPVYFLPRIAKLFPKFTGLNKIKTTISTLHGWLAKVVEEHQKNCETNNEHTCTCECIWKKHINKESNPIQSNRPGVKSK